MACVAWSPTSTAWKIAGHLALPFPWCEDEEEFLELYDVGVDDLCELTRLTTATIFQTFVENQGFFEVEAGFYGKKCQLYVSMMSELELFLKEESRSKALHFAYRSIVIHTLSSKIPCTLNASQSFVTFSTLFIIRILKKRSLVTDFIVSTTSCMHLSGNSKDAISGICWIWVT